VYSNLSLGVQRARNLNLRVICTVCTVYSCSAQFLQRVAAMLRAVLAIAFLSVHRRLCWEG